MASRLGDLSGFIFQQNSPRHKQLGDFHSEGLSHVLTADIGNTLESQGNMNWVPAGQIILDALYYQLNQLRVAGYQY